VDGAVPDLTILLDLPAELGLRRLRGRRSGRAVSRDRIEREALSFHRRVRRGYRLLARRFPDRFRVIDAAQDRRLVEQAVWKAVSDVFGQRI
jgi:dTMP kinase